MLFTRKLKRSARPIGPPARDPLTAIPRRSPGVESRDDGNLVQLRRVLPPRNRFDALWRRWLRLERTIRVNLDAHGSFYWRLVDGQRELSVIAGLFATHFSVPLDDARRATVAFTRDLMVRHLIQLEIRNP